MAMEARARGGTRIATAWLTLLLGACSAPSAAGTCESASDCAATSGVCADGQCRACASDDECAPYGAGATCQEGACASCTGDAGCGCDPGQVGCACRVTGSPCGLGLACVDGMCAECPEGSGGCACRTSGDACDAGLACRDRACAACDLGTEGCDCDAGETCGAGLFCATDGHCRAPASCDDLRGAGLCPEGRSCALIAGAPTCLDTCEAGYQLDGGECVLCGPDGCVATTCADLDCASVHRTCAVPDGTPACGDCEAGYAVDTEMHCVDERLCGGSVCPDGQMPMHESDGSCTCIDTPCATGEARNAEGVCVTCSITCGGVEGETGDIHPLASGLACMCETRDGYFVPPGEDGRARRCDDDGDGWIGATALAAEQSPDVAIASNARCTLRRAARVDLVNEYGQTLELRPCADGLLADRAGAGPALCNDFGSLEPIVLVEPDRNDRQDELAAEAVGPLATAPAYGTGRTFRANELNALTRACSDEHADYDADGRADIAETQVVPSAALDNASRLDALSFFTELHTATFVEGAGDGTLVITERMRCAACFPLGYGTLDGGSTYWRGCHRQRDARFGRPTQPPGLDFAAFSCDAPSGTCEVPIPSTGRPRTECPGGGACHETAPFHDACEPVSDWGTEWRGMHHATQFRCVLVDDASSSPYAEPVAAIGAGGHLAFQRCSLDTTGGISCAPSATTGVGWAAVRFTPSVEIPAGDLITDTAPVTEVFGCLDEARASFDGTSWSSALCPAPDDPAITLTRDFGRLDCPCEASETRCSDGSDDDCDGLVDCVDPDCDALSCGANGLVCGGGACACPGGTTESTCDDGADGDCDGLVDCADVDCGARTCGVNGLTCIGGACQCPGSTESCNDRDDDCDGTADEGCPGGVIASSGVTDLPRHGGGGGGAYNLLCPRGHAIVGVDVRAGTLVDNIQPRCAALGLAVDKSRTPDFGYSVVWGGDPYSLSSTGGGGGGGPYQLRCSRDQFVMGLAGGSGVEVDRIQFQCGTVSVERSGTGWRVVVRSTGTTATVGGGGGAPFSDVCPSASVIRGFQGRSGAVIDQVGGRCTTLSVSAL